MTTVLLTIFIFLLAVGLLSIGTIFGNRHLNSSCGNTGGSCSCSDATKANCHNK
ncbi:MAG: DUF539 domain-containing protein [Candidatus Marinimicrobia bacterium]|nr:DUF539 domain-containing protein [Candidatus Neomarinimicrobiota bacterium]MBT3682673.1 DUF539 domain-containing protein [Candidatus Neomarinimicrobiota bacterium]MBT3759672.1 DUF539 domain-containing protein [Candidatus Neomarinimicrobiota bacterium]MBT4172499.1 DUF539 domain-containing protein [Candidatus Neomarinimicrobiota bacterium]MBT4851178.1 DUF539 domain-containing protein [Candidatus Neomarinimicrobiota bacterium]